MTAPKDTAVTSPDPRAQRRLLAYHGSKLLHEFVYGRLMSGGPREIAVSISPRSTDRCILVVLQTGSILAVREWRPTDGQLAAVCDEIVALAAKFGVDADPG